MRIHAFPLILALTLTVVSMPDVVRAERPTPFDAGNVTVSLGGGIGSGRGNVSGGVGYYVVKGLETSVQGSFWFGGDAPNVGTLGPGVRYVLWQIPMLHPYGGAFYRHWFVGGGFDDRDSVGLRGGAVLYSAPFAVSAGVVYEAFLSCETVDCTDFYPEISFGLSF